MPQRRSLWWGLLLILLAGRSGVAETFVVACGVEKYEDERISALRYAVADARSVAAAFRASGVNQRAVTLLTTDTPGAEKQPSRIKLLTALEAVKSRAKAGDKVVFFFAGHGLEQDGQQYLLTSDTRLSLVSATALPMQLVCEALRGLQASEVLFLVDACRNDPRSGRATVDAPLTEGLARGLRLTLTAEAGEPPKMVATLLSCEVGQRAWENPEAGHGVFTQFLLQGLAGGVGAVGEPLTLSALAGFVTTHLREWSAKSGKPQVPRLVKPDDRDMVVLVPPAEPVISVAFDNLTLTQAIQSLGEQYGTQIVLGAGVDPALKVNGRLENQPLSVALKVLLVAYDLRVRRDGRVCVIEGKEAATTALVVAQDGSGNCRTIMEAVKKAGQGSTIKIRPGVYREAVKLYYPVELLSEADRDKVVIEAVGQTALRVTSRDARVKGLTVRLLPPERPVTGDEPPAVSPVVVEAGAELKLDSCRLTSEWAVATNLEANGSAVLTQTQSDGSARTGAVAQDDGSLSLEECQFWTTAAGAQVRTGGVLKAQRCRFQGGDVGLTLGAAGGQPGRAELAECDLYGRQAGLHVAEGATAKLTGCWLTNSPGAGVRVAQPESRVELARCTLTGLADGAVTAMAGAAVTQVALTDCTVMALAAEAPPWPAGGPTMVVAQDGTGQFKTIADAVAQASPGDTIKVKPGLYNESLRLSKPVKLLGDGPRDKVVIQSAADWVVTVDSPDVWLHGLTIGAVAPEATPQGERRCTVLRVERRATVRLSGSRLTSACPVSTNLAVQGRAEVSRCLSDAVSSPCYMAYAGGFLALTDCQAESLGVAGVNVFGGQVRALRCRFSSSMFGLTVWAYKQDTGGAELEDCDLSGPNGPLFARDGCAVKATRCRMVNGKWYGVRIERPATRIELDRCTITGNSQGPFYIANGATADQIVQKDCIVSAAPVRAEVRQPTLLVAQDGTGQYKTIGEALKQAAPDSWVRVRPGVYRDSLICDKPVNITGDGSRDQVVIEAVGQRVIHSLSRGVRISGVTIRQVAPPANPAGDDWRFATAVEAAPGAELLLEGNVLSSNWDVHVLVASLGQTTVRSCRLEGQPRIAVSAGEKGTVVLQDCQLDGQVWGGEAVKGGVLKARRCRFKGGLFSVSVWANSGPPSRAELDDCDLAGAGGGLTVGEGSTARLTQCRLRDNPGVGVRVADPKTRVELDRCTVTNNAKGPLEWTSGATMEQIVQKDCTVK